MTTVTEERTKDAIASIRQLTESVKSLVLELERQVSAMRPPSDERVEEPPQPGERAGALEDKAKASKDAAREAADRALAEFLSAVPTDRGRTTTRIGRAEATQLLVRLDGVTICRPKSVDTFVEAVRKIGLERVRNLGLQLCGVPLVSSNRPVGYQNATRVDGVYVVTHASNRTKKLLLEQIARRLGVPIEIEIK